MAPPATPPRPLASAVFIAAFYAITAVVCIAALPALAFPGGPHAAVRAYERALAWAERAILGLSYEVRGPVPAGPCIIAAKHYSTYETLKLHMLLDRPAIVLKAELLTIPLWGAFLARAGAIPIDRSRGARALKSMDAAARAAAREGRAIVIFPQGTRVALADTPAERPYRSGVAQLQAATSLPIVPLATNSGVFWPRGDWRKRGGVATFQFLPPIPPGLERRALLDTLAERLEAASGALVAGALADSGKRR